MSKTALFRVLTVLSLMPLGAMAACESTSTEVPIASVISSAERDALQPSACIERLKQGNKRFVSERPSLRNWKAQMEASALGASPYAAVLTDIDSRLPLELAFDVGVGELIQIRNAGPTLTAGAVAALESAVENGVRTIVVMGVSDSPWAEAAMEPLSDAEPSVGPVGQFVGQSFRSAAAEATNSQAPPVVDSLSEADVVTTTHVQSVVRSLAERSPVLGARWSEGTLEVAPAFYDIATGAVIWL
ncbi:MAG: carbonic anhydrase [Planctomycetota bacterium]